jgi:hypothetical protein
MGTAVQSIKIEWNCIKLQPQLVMSVLVTGIHAFSRCGRRADGRNKSGDDDLELLRYRIDIAYRVPRRRSRTPSAMR